MGAFPAVLTEPAGSTQATGDTGTVSDMLVCLLAEHPAAWIGAIGPDARYVPMPPGAPGGGHPVLEGRWALDLVDSSDRAALSKAWRELRNDSVVRLAVRLVTGDPATFFLFGVTERYGTDLLVVVAEPGADVAGAVHRPSALVPRFCRVVRDEAGRITEIDQSAPLVLGWAAEVLLGRDPPLNRVHPDDHARVLDNWMSMLAGDAEGHRCRARVGRADGSWRWLEITNFNHLADLDNPRVISETLDISDEMTAHEAVRAREQLLDRLTEALPLGVLQLAHDRRIIYTNDRLKAILGYPLAVTADEQFAATVPSDRPRLRAAIDDSLHTGSDHELTIGVRHGRPDAERLIQVIIRSLRRDDGTVAGIIACVSDVTDTIRMSRELEQRATYDSLTGCHNRASILALLDTALLDAHGGAGTAAVFVDLDGLKALNDRYGHAVGDELLKHAAQGMRHATGAGDLVGRLGGDEFVIVSPNTVPSDAMQMAERVAAILVRRRGGEDGQIQLQASIGVAWAAPNTLTVDELVARADTAMYISKRGGAGIPHQWTAADRHGNLQPL